MPSPAMACSTSCRRPCGSSGVPTSTPRVSCARITAWSMSSTSTRWVASAVNSTPVTPGRSGPVTVISTEDMTTARPDRLSTDERHSLNGAPDDPEPSPSGIFRAELASASSRAFQPRAGCASVRIRSIMYG